MLNTVFCVSSFACSAILVENWLRWQNGNFYECGPSQEDGAKVMESKKAEAFKKVLT